ncbi:hypothetical protein ACCY16_20220 [Candidatus Pantoea formicae]|uniref:hypothetical protein n=1 Tax=Candidatus Pantoea formicae TaxID=2608355 RepID=UPI003ED9C1AE
MVATFTFLFTDVGGDNMHTALSNKVKEVKSKTLDGWDLNEKQLAFIEAVLKDDLQHQITHLQNIDKKMPVSSSNQ